MGSSPGSSPRVSWTRPSALLDGAPRGAALMTVVPGRPAGWSTEAADAVLAPWVEAGVLGDVEVHLVSAVLRAAPDRPDGRRPARPGAGGACHAPRPRLPGPRRGRRPARRRPGRRRTRRPAWTCPIPADWRAQLARSSVVTDAGSAPLPDGDEALRPLVLDGGRVYLQRFWTLRGRRRRRRATPCRRERRRRSPRRRGGSGRPTEPDRGVRRRAPRRGRCGRPPVRGGGAGAHPTAVGDRRRTRHGQDAHRRPDPGRRPPAGRRTWGLAPGRAGRPHRQGRRPDGRGGGGAGGRARGRRPSRTRGRPNACGPSPRPRSTACCGTGRGRRSATTGRIRSSTTSWWSTRRRWCRCRCWPDCSTPCARRHAWSWWATRSSSPASRPAPSWGTWSARTADERSTATGPLAGRRHRTAAGPPVRRRIGHRRAGPGRAGRRRRRGARPAGRRRPDGALGAAGRWSRTGGVCGRSSAGRPARWSRRRLAGAGAAALEAAGRIKVLAAVRRGPLGLDEWTGRIDRDGPAASCRRRWPAAGPGSAHRSS